MDVGLCSLALGVLAATHLIGTLSNLTVLGDPYPFHRIPSLPLRLSCQIKLMGMASPSTKTTSLLGHEGFF